MSSPRVRHCNPEAVHAAGPSQSAWFNFPAALLVRVPPFALIRECPALAAIAGDAALSARVPVGLQPLAAGVTSAQIAGKEKPGISRAFLVEARANYLA